MGLDHYVYRMKQIGKKTLLQLNGKKEDDFDYHEYLILDKDYVDDNPSMYKDIMTILRPIQIVKEYVNMDLIRKDNNIPEDWHLGLRSYGEDITYGFYGRDHQSKQVHLTVEQHKKYEYSELVDSYICYCTEVHYMRKEYDIQDAMYELHDGDIQNCGYYHMSEEMIDKLNELSGRKVLDESATNLYYHEWY